MFATGNGQEQVALGSCTADRNKELFVVTAAGMLSLKLAERGGCLQEHRAGSGTCCTPV
jgi:hypothetical protein